MIELQKKWKKQEEITQEQLKSTCDVYENTKQAYIIESDVLQENSQIQKIEKRLY